MRTSHEVSDGICQFNILVSPSKRACLTDIGQAASKEFEPVVVNVPFWKQGSSSKKQHALGMKWQAPELVLAEYYRTAAPPKTPGTDIYAFAMVCYEVQEFFLFT
jgi:hypothetical protein